MKAPRSGILRLLASPAVAAAAAAGAASTGLPTPAVLTAAVLFGGGICIARAFQASGLGDAIGIALAGLAGLPVLLMTLVICLAVTFLTEITSNPATTTLLMPILAAAAATAGIEPAGLMVPAAISASCAFMLPVATAPNAIVFGTDRIPITEMARRGVTLNLVGAAVIPLTCSVLLANGLV